VALLWKMIYNLGDPMSLRHPVHTIAVQLTIENAHQEENLEPGEKLVRAVKVLANSNGPFKSKLLTKLHPKQI